MNKLAEHLFRSALPDCAAASVRLSRSAQRSAVPALPAAGLPGAAALPGVTAPAHAHPALGSGRRASFSVLGQKAFWKIPLKHRAWAARTWLLRCWRCPRRALLYPELLLLGSCISLLPVPLLPAWSSHSFSPFPASNHSITSIFAGHCSPPCRCPRPSFVIAVVIS